MNEVVVWMAALALPVLGVVLWLLGTAISEIYKE